MERGSLPLEMDKGELNLLHPLLPSSPLSTPLSEWWGELLIRIE